MISTKENIAQHVCLFDETMVLVTIVQQINICGKNDERHPEIYLFHHEITIRQMYFSRLTELDQCKLIKTRHVIFALFPAGNLIKKGHGIAVTSHEFHGVSYQRQPVCRFNSLFGLTSKRTRQTEKGVHKPDVNSIINEHNLTYTTDFKYPAVKNSKCILHHSQTLLEYVAPSVSK